MTVGIVSSGHMGAGLGWALREGGARVIATVDGRSARTARLAEAAGLELVPDLRALVTAASVILVVTPPGEAVHAASAIAHTCTTAGVRCTVADLNATAPSTVDEMAAVYGAAGLELVDGSISGPPPTVRPGARIYLSGSAAERIAALPWRHVEPIVLSGPPGLASAVKMCTASVYKGLDGLLAQATLTAQAFGVLDHVLNDLERGGFDKLGRLAVAAAKAHRYVPEMREIAAAQRAAGLTPDLFDAFARIYAEVARSPLGAADPETVDRTASPADIVAGITPRPAG